jgi:hypothetical protein
MIALYLVMLLMVAFIETSGKRTGARRLDTTIGAINFGDFVGQSDGRSRIGENWKQDGRSRVVVELHAWGSARADDSGRLKQQRGCAAFHQQVLESFNLALGVFMSGDTSGLPKHELKCNPNTCPRSSGASQIVFTVVLWERALTLAGSWAQRMTEEQSQVPKRGTRGWRCRNCRLHLYKLKPPGIPGNANRTGSSAFTRDVESSSAANSGFPSDRTW